MTVMIVENSGVMQRVWRDMLDRIDGLILIGIYSGAPAAIASLSHVTPDIVLLDIQLDEGCGIDVLRVLAARQSDAKVIVVTSDTDAVYRRYYTHAGAYAFYGKEEFDAIHHTLASLANPGLANAALG